MHDAVIVAATRTPIGRFQGGLANLSGAELGAIVIRRLLEDAPSLPIDEVLMGQVLTGGAGQNPARQAALHAGLPHEVPATTLSKVCGSGLKAVQLAAQAIRAGDATAIIAGGMESMSNAPYLLPRARNGLRMGHGEVIDSMIQDGLWDAFNDYHMGITAENLAERYGIDRAAQDAFAAESHRKAIAAQQAGAFLAEITPVTVRTRRGEQRIDRDEQPRDDVTPGNLAGLRAAFSNTGSVTAGNASSLNDGAAAVLVMNAEHAHRQGLPILARITGYASAGVDPAVMGIGPVSATRRALAMADWSLNDLDLIEANEAFAAQALAVGQELGWDSRKLNINGGAIALGHPIGASGCRVLVTLLHALQHHNAKRGLATLCIGGGQGVALAIER